VIKPRGGNGTEVGVIFGENLFNFDKIFSLNQPTFFAHHNSKRVAFLNFFKVGAGQIGIGKGWLAKVSKNFG